MNKNKLKIVFLLLLGAILMTGFWYFDIPALLRSFLGSIENLGPQGPILFAFIYIVACVLFIPGSILTLGAGVVFG